MSDETKTWTATWYELHLEHNGHLLLLQSDATLEDARHALALRKGCDKCKDNVYRILKVTQTTEEVG